MHLQRSIKVQFVVFVVIAVTALTILAFGYGGLAAKWFGTGEYTVTVNLAETGGLYSRANVTYRGTTVGRVDDVTLTDDGVHAELSLQKQFDIPSPLSAEVHSQSAIGEQFIELVPEPGAASSLRPGDEIPVNRTSVPPDINDQLDMTSTGLKAIPKDDLKTVVDEGFVALSGLGPDLSRLFDAASALTDQSQRSLTELNNVIDNSSPLLDSQTRSSDQITAWSANLANVTGQLQAEDPALSGVLANGGSAAEGGRALLNRLRPTVPILMANLVTLADIGVVYNPNIEQTLVLLPVTLAQNAASGVANRYNPGLRGGLQAANLNLNLPPPCTTGFLPASQRRSPALEDTPELPVGDLYCRIPQDAPWNVRGARNIPCANNPAQRAPLVWMCESGTPYVPLNEGNNWKGDPNATTTGQDVPQLRPGEVRPPDTPPASNEPAVPFANDGTPPSTAPPALVGVADYNPADGTYVGSDGQVYTQTNLAAVAAPPTLETMLLPTIEKGAP